MIKILVVEDIIVNRLVIKQYFQKDHHVEVQEASDGLEAISKIKTERYDVVLMDIRMPIMDGLESTRTIRTLPIPSLSNIPVIALTANMTDDLLNQQHQQDFTDVVSKPFNARELRDKVMQCVGLDHNTYVRQKKNYSDQLLVTFDFGKVESSLRHHTGNIVYFYQESEQLLEKHESALIDAIKRHDPEAVDEIVRNAVIALQMLYLEELQVVLQIMPIIMAEQWTGDRLQELIRQTHHQFGEAILMISERRKYIIKNGL